MISVLSRSDALLVRAPFDAPALSAIWSPPCRSRRCCECPTLRLFHEPGAPPPRAPVAQL